MYRLMKSQKFTLDHPSVPISFYRQTQVKHFQKFQSDPAHAQ